MVKFKILAIPWFSLNFQLFMTEGEEPRSGAEANFGLRHPAGMMPCKPNISSPRAPADLSRRESRCLAQKRDKYFDAFTRQIFLPLALLWIK